MNQIVVPRRKGDNHSPAVDAKHGLVLLQRNDFDLVGALRRFDARHAIIAVDTED